MLILVELMDSRMLGLQLLVLIHKILRHERAVHT